jgi:hypothetical protein
MSFSASQKVLGKMHHDTLRNLYFISVLHMTFGDWIQARDVVRDCYWKQLEALGRDHPSTIDSLNHYAAMCRRLGDLDEVNKDNTHALLVQEHKCHTACLDTPVYICPHECATMKHDATNERIDRLILSE